MPAHSLPFPIESTSLGLHPKIITIKKKEQQGEKELNLGLPLPHLSLAKMMLYRYTVL